MEAVVRLVDLLYGSYLISNSLLVPQGLRSRLTKKNPLDQRLACNGKMKLGVTI